MTSDVMTSVVMSNVFMTSDVMTNTVAPINPITSQVLNLKIGLEWS